MTQKSPVSQEILAGNHPRTRSPARAAGADPTVNPHVARIFEMIRLQRLPEGTAVPGQAVQVFRMDEEGEEWYDLEEERQARSSLAAKLFIWAFIFISFLVILGSDPPDTPAQSRLGIAPSLAELLAPWFQSPIGDASHFTHDQFQCVDIFGLPVSTVRFLGDPGWGDGNACKWGDSR